MPQLVKGGKHVFAWTLVGQVGEIRIPPEALAEYKLRHQAQLYLMPASRTSGGFVVGERGRILDSPIGSLINAHHELRSCRVPEGESILLGSNRYCWVTLREGCIVVPTSTLRFYDVYAGSRLLAVRGSGLAISHIVRGPIVEEAKKHPEIEVFSTES